MWRHLTTGDFAFVLEMVNGEILHRRYVADDFPAQIA